MTVNINFVTIISVVIEIVIINLYHTITVNNDNLEVNSKLSVDELHT